MANFIGLVYSTLKNEGIDTTGMSTDEAVAKFKELQKSSGGKEGEEQGTPAEQRKIKNINDANDYKSFEQNDYKIADDGSIIMDYKKFDRIMEERNNFYKNSFDKLYEEIGESGKNNLRWAVDYYSAGDYEYINAILRDKNVNLDVEKKKELQKYTEDIQNSIKNFEIPQDIKLYRNINIKALADLGINENNIKELEGMTYNEKGFSSSSMDKAVANEFGEGQFKNTGDKQILFEINVPKGKNRGIPIYNLSNFEHEQEVLLKDNSNFRINKVINEDGKIIIQGDML